MQGRGCFRKGRPSFFMHGGRGARIPSLRLSCPSSHRGFGSCQAGFLTLLSENGGCRTGCRQAGGPVHAVPRMSSEGPETSATLHKEYPCCAFPAMHCSSFCWGSCCCRSSPLPRRRPPRPILQPLVTTPCSSASRTA